MASLEQSVFDYLAHRHIDLMTPDVTDRFDKYRKTGSFNGHMRNWDTLYYGQAVKMLTTTLTDPADWKKLYTSCQKTFQKMYENKKPSVGIGNTYIPAINTFIDKWFGPDANKTFTYAKATNDAERVFTQLSTFLKSDPRLEQVFTREGSPLAHVFKDISFSKFCKKIDSKEYNKDTDFQKKLKAVIQYIITYGPQPDYGDAPDPSLWPVNCGYSLTATGVQVSAPVLQSILYDRFSTPPTSVIRLDSDPDNWYETKDLDKHIKWFTKDYVDIFDELLTNPDLRKKFLEMAEDPIQTALIKAIEYTDYENPESKDFVPPDVTDSKNWLQKIKKWKDDTYENHFRRFTNPARGTRIFFSPHSQNIMKAFDKAGIKPTDGLEGILSKEKDAKLQNVINSDPTTKKHFDWFIKKMNELKTETPDDFEGALRDGGHLRQLAINLIIKAGKEGRSDKGVKDKAMTALEVLSTAKYSLLCSRTFNRLSEATKDMKILSDDGLSWNKNEGIKMVTKAIDATAGFAIRTVGAAATGIRNFISFRKTKIGADISRYKNLDKAYKDWQQEDHKRHTDLLNSNNAHYVTQTLSDLDNAARTPVPGTTAFKTSVQINKSTVENLQAQLTAAGSTTPPTTTVNINGTSWPVDDLQSDIDLFNDLYGRQQQDANWRDNNPDIMHDLIAHWDMLETASKTHAFTLGNMQLKRDAMLRNWNLKTSDAQTITKNNMIRFGRLRTS